MGITDPKRRDVLFYTTSAAGAVAVGGAVWPLVTQMGASADVKALSTIEVDISGIEPGSQMVVEWQLQPVFIRRRTEAEIAEANDVDISSLRDQNAENANLPTGSEATDVNRSFGENGEWIIAIGLCTHLGCVPTVNAGDFGGWFCPCHGSHYDTAARIRRGPAPRNLPIPPVEFRSETVVRIG